MDAYEARFASFASKKSSKSKKQQATSGGWPHPPTFRATPARLAQAGFYFKPSTSKPDNVLCFMCGHALGSWEEGDDPFRVHVEHSPKCAWAIARCSIEDDKRGNKFVFTSTARLPTSRTLEKARAETFKGAWPHDHIKGHSASSTKMARAGWVFTPESQEDSDTATCFYCGKTLAGWEPEDNPTEEHKNRMPNCPFFTAKVTPEEDPEDEIILADLALSQPSQSKGSTSRSRSGRAHTRTASQSKRMAAAASASEAEPGGDGEDDALVPSKKKLPSTASLKSVTLTAVEPPRVTKSASSRRVKTQDEDTEMVVDITEEPPQPTVSKSSSKTKKGKAKTPQAIELSDLDVQEVAPTSTKSSKKAKGKQRAIEEVQVIDLDDDEDGEVPPPPKKVARKPSKSSSKSKRGKTKPATVVQEDELEAEPETLIEPVDIEMKEHPLGPPSTKAPPPLVAQPPPPKPSQVVPAVVPKLRPPLPSKDEDMDLKAAEEELDNMAMELDPTGEVRSLLKSKTSSSRPASSRSDVKPQKTSSSSSSRHHGQESAMQMTSLTWLKAGPKSMSHAGSVRAMMAEDEIEEEEVARSLNEIEGEGEVDIEVITKLRPQSRNPERPPFTVPPVQTNGHSKTPVEHPTSSSASIKGNAKAVHPFPSEVAPPEPRTPPPAHTAVTNMFPLGEVDRLPSLLLPEEASIHHLTEEDKDMTLEAYIRREIERRKEELRADGQRWIEGFLAYAEQAREKIRAM